MILATSLYIFEDLCSCNRYRELTMLEVYNLFKIKFSEFNFAFSPTPITLYRHYKTFYIVF